jgi:hypothetical protein
MTTCDIPGCENERLMSWRPVGPERAYRVCRQHADRDHDPEDPFDLCEAFGPSRSQAKPPETARLQLRRFPEFGAELRRPFQVHEVCFDCAEFYDGCTAWPASKSMKSADKKHLRCLDFLPLPDVLPGSPTGQVFPSSRMKGRKVPRERQTELAPARAEPKAPMSALVASPIDPKRHCACGRQLPRRRRYCDACREARKLETMARFNEQHPNRSHRGAPEPVAAARGAVSAAVARGNS